MKFLILTRTVPFALIFFVTLGAHADYYRCLFTEPFLSVLISTQYKIVTISDLLQNSSTSKRIQNIDRHLNEILVTTEGDFFFTIYNSKPGSDGMSDRHFPYDVQLKGVRSQPLWGGCERETYFRSTIVVERAADTAYPFGVALVNFWPREYGFVTGYKTKSEVTIKPGLSYSNLTPAEASKRPCTLGKGKLIVDSKKLKFETFLTITQVEFQKNDKEAFLISHLGEGFCLFEINGIYQDLPCPHTTAPSPSASPKRTKSENAPLGEYAYLRCTEGHFAYMPRSLFQDDERYDPINLSL